MKAIIKVCLNDLESFNLKSLNGSIRGKLLQALCSESCKVNIMFDFIEGIHKINIVFKACKMEGTLLEEVSIC